MAPLARRTRPNREERRDDVRDRLLGAIEQLTAEGESFTTVSVERMTAAAGLSRATFYIYFSDKGDLLDAWFQQTIDDLREAAAPWWHFTSRSSYEDLEAVVGRVVRTYRPRAGLMAAVYGEATFDASVRSRLNGMMDDAVTALRVHIERGQREGWIDAELRSAETAGWVGWMLERGLNEVVPAAPAEELDALIATCADMLWHALYADAPSRRRRGLTAPPAN
jgi:AcrR family transcriptional regulator